VSKANSFKEREQTPKPFGKIPALIRSAVALWGRGFSCQSRMLLDEFDKLVLVLVILEPSFVVLDADDWVAASAVANNTAWSFEIVFGDALVGPVPLTLDLFIKQHKSGSPR
jgi:hypothetical protein